LSQRKIRPHEMEVGPSICVLGGGSDRRSSSLIVMQESGGHDAACCRGRVSSGGMLGEQMPGEEGTRQEPSQNAAVVET